MHSIWFYANSMPLFMLSQPKIFLGFRVNQLKVDITELGDELEALKKDVHRESVRGSM